MIPTLLVASSLWLAAPEGVPEAAPQPPPATGAASFVSKAYGFSARFPCAATDKAGEMASPAGPLELHHFRCSPVEKGATAFGVFVMIPPAGVAAQVATQEFARTFVHQTTADIAKGAGGKVLSEGVVRSGSVEGYEAIVEAAGGRGRYRAFPHRGRVYSVVAIGKTQRAAEADAFVESFELNAR